ncbi:MAG TPA: MBL fold metallo-hydrolase [Xanthobacteraceae bacterium]|nr:MBL fold metallo-hydrolase [Xanthobacteraceae bacterium]
MARLALTVSGLFALVALCCGTAAGQENAPSAPNTPGKPEMRESCPGLVAANRPRVVPAAFRVASLAPGEARITYIGHATFLLESPKLVRIATDYNDYVRPPVLPDIATMNHAHLTHYTDHPDPGIKYVLRGWREDGRPAAHDLTYEDVHVRSVATNIRDFAGGTERHGNSIFIFEIGSLCIAHLGHLHHTLTQQQLDEIGGVDVVLAPVDGSFTLDLDGMMEVLQALKAPLVIPMHYFSRFTLERFLERARASYAVEFSETPSLVVSRATLPSTPKVLVLPGH